MLKKVFILTTIGLVLLALSYYLMQSFSPFKQEKLEELIESKEIEEEDIETLNSEINIIIKDGFILDYLSSNAYLTFGLILASVLCLFSSLHLTIDKLFFKKFYEVPSLFDAVRRGIWISLSLGLMFYLKLFGSDIYTLLSVPIAAFILEVFFTIYLRKEIYKRVKRLRASK